MTGLLQDVRYSLRQLSKQPAFTAVVVITLTLAIGANTAIFSLARTVLFAPLPYKDVERLMMIWGRNTSRGDNQFPISAGDFNEWKQKNNVFEDVAASYDNEVTLTGSGEPKLVLGYAFTPNYFRILGTQPMMGRTFSDEEAQSGAPVVVLNHKFWTTTLHGDSQILRKALTLDGKPYTVIGVMPAGFEYPSRTELWMPFHVSPGTWNDFAHTYIRVIGRLKPEVSVGEAQAAMNALERQVALQHSQTDAGNETWVEPVRHQLSGDIRTPLLVLLAAAGIVLLIACVNIAGLSLARVASRKNEIATRVAMGASRFRVLRQSLTESVLLALLGGVLGLVLAFMCTRFLVAIFPNNVANLNIPTIETIPSNASVFWFALAITVLTAVLFGAAPSYQLSRTRGVGALKESCRTVASGTHSVRIRNVLVAVQIALSLLLLTGAGLMIESFLHVYQQDLGFRADHLIALEVFLPSSRYPETPPQQRMNFVSGVLDELKKLPGVDSVAATNFLPLSGFWGTADFTIEGMARKNPAEKPQADNRLITPGYFSTMKISLLRGRDFTEADRSGTEPIAIVNSTLARRYFAGQDPIGRVVELDEDGHPQRWRIVGVAADVKAFGPEEPAHADLYRPLAQVTFPLLAFTVRSQSDPATLLNAAKQAVWNLDKNQPVLDALPLSALAEQSLALRRVSTILIGSFAALALLLAAVGLYGLVAYTVSQRTHEIGIRMALGAQRGEVLRFVVRNGMQLTLIGEIIGLSGAIIAARAVSSLLYGVKPADPVILAAGVCFLAAVAALASYLPARRAAKVDPMVALRYE